MIMMKLSAYRKSADFLDVTVTNIRRLILITGFDNILLSLQRSISGSFSNDNNSLTMLFYMLFCMNMSAN